MLTITAGQIGIVVGILTIGSAIFTIFFYFQKPQIALEKKMRELFDDHENTKKELSNLRADHIMVNDGLQKEFKEMTFAMNNLDKTVVRLSTIIEERIPKGSPNLTPPGK